MTSILLVLGENALPRTVDQSTHEGSPTTAGFPKCVSCRIGHGIMIRPVALTVLLLVISAACGSETTSSDDDGAAGSGGIDDGKLRPEPNGVRISEAEACQLMHGALQSKVEQLKCTKTLRPCPNFLRTVYPTKCSEYDQGTVQGCVDHWNGIFNCDILDETDCVVVDYPENAPAECPEG